MVGSIGSILARARAATTLGQQVAGFTALLCLILVGVLSYTAAETARQQANARIQSSMNAVASSMSDRLTSYLAERLREVSEIGALKPLKHVWGQGADEIRPVLDQMQAGLPDYAWIGLARPDGTVLAATKGILEGRSVADRPWFVNGTKHAYVGDVHEAKLLAPFLGNDALGEPFRLVDVAVPITDEGGRFIGVLGAHISWSWASELRKLFLSRLDPKLKTDIWILSDDGAVLLGPAFGLKPFSAARLAEIKNSGRVNFVDTSGRVPVLTSALVSTRADPTAGLTWIIVARRPFDVASAEANSIAGSIGVMGMGLAAIGVICAMLLARRVTKPLSRLAARVDLIGRDPSVTMVKREHGAKEIVQLSSSIRSLLRRIAHAEGAEVAARQEASAIEMQMEEKTRRLGEHISTLQVLADTDPLTRLLNRRAFMLFATDAMNFHRRHGQGVAILVIDIDFFKRVNDDYGHAIGDDAIRIVAQTVGAQVRSTDKVARFGGEEFVVMLRSTDAEGATVLAERIREAIAATVIDTADGPLRVTVSIGLAMVTAEDRDIADVIERADRGLYRAKHEGRNRVVAETDGARAINAA